MSVSIFSFIRSVQQTNFLNERLAVAFENWSGSMVSKRLESEIQVITVWGFGLS